MVKKIIAKKGGNGKKLGVKKLPIKQPRNVASEMQRNTEAYIRLLSDPCRSALAHAPYMGTGSGYLMRTKSVVSPTGSTGARDFVVDIHPAGTLHVHAGVAYAVMGKWGYSTDVGGSLGASNPVEFPTMLWTTSGYFRPVAGCAKVWYNGSEMDRSGQIGTTILSGDMGEVDVLTAPQYLARSQRVVRLGDEPHEVRWLPNLVDGAWVSTAEPGGSLPSGTVSLTGNSIRVVGTGVPPGSVSLEITFVWEWTPKDVNGGIVADMTRPAMYNLNTVLGRIRNVVEFATNPSTVAAASSFASGVYNIATKAGQALAMLA